MKRKQTKINRILVVVIVFIAICLFVSYIFKNPYEAGKASICGIGAFVVYCISCFISGYFIDMFKKD